MSNFFGASTRVYSQGLWTKPLGKFLKLALPRGQWRFRHTQHVACELRRWQGRKSLKRGRFRDLGNASKRAKVRNSRLKQVYQKLGFRNVPPLAKAA